MMDKLPLWRLVSIAVIAAWFALQSCSGGGAVDSATTPDPPGGKTKPDEPSPIAAVVTGLFGSGNSGVTCLCAGSRLVVNFSALPETGKLVQISLPASYNVGAITWSGIAPAEGAATAVTLCVPTPNGCDIGVVPLAGYAGETISLAAVLDVATHAGTQALSGSENAVRDPVALLGQPGKINLTWTQVIAGDYNFDGSVDLRDLRALAVPYGSRVESSAAAAASRTEYWLDGNGDGLVDASDVETILFHYGNELGGYNIRRNGELVPGPGTDEPTIVKSQAHPRPGLPPQYALQLAGAPSDTWAVTVVGTDGEEGACGVASPYSPDLIANVTVDGITLADLAGGDPGEAEIIKFGTRIIDPTEDLGRPQIAKPRRVNGGSSVYSDLPRNKPLMLDIRYSPLVDLADGSTHSPAAAKQAAATIDELPGLQITAIPFSLPDNGDVLQIQADVQFRVNPSGGYFVCLISTLAYSEGALQTTISRLNCKEGLLQSDSDGNGQLADELEFKDDDCDQVSNQHKALDQDSQRYSMMKWETLVVRGQSDALDPVAGYCTLREAEVLNSAAPLVLDGVRLKLHEQTEFAAELNPAQWLAGQLLSLNVVRMYDPAGVLPDVYWANSLELISNGDAQQQGALLASDNLPGRVELTWQPVPGFIAYMVERSAPLGGQQNPKDGKQVRHYFDFHLGGWDWSRMFHTTEPSQFTDVLVQPGFAYDYKYYGIAESGSRTLLGEDIGSAAYGASDLPPEYIHLGHLVAVADESLVLVCHHGTLTISWDSHTLWRLANGDQVDAAQFNAGDKVFVIAEQAGAGLKALQVAKVYY